jgi:pimeloyl-ACP methyl ester carboxylesterase
VVETLRFGDERTARDGLRERFFDLEVGGERVPGVLWTPGSGGPFPLVLAGHGLTQHKHRPFPRPWVRSLASQHGCAVALLDAPGHGDRRADPAESAAATAASYGAHWRAHGGSRIAREYEAVEAALLAEPEVAAGPVGYFGLSLATQYGLAYLARSRNVAAAVLGLFGRGEVVARYAARVTCPVFFVQQLDDEVHARESVAALYAALASSEKRLAASAGRHQDVPDSVSAEAVGFLVGRLRLCSR